ncbi:unnamed protein product [Phytophthora fragariaefolia]|uniref:Unnamed protein product n=1 Tax=Phytophthora fragariaefolia TaxID=1490495 RepID=A0A9W6XQM3_9STRA|nr:unnamed protein product [Phytophthora fragariaefolia]
MSGATQIQMNIRSASMATRTTVSAIQLDSATKKAFQKGYAKDPVYTKLWHSKQPTNEYEFHEGLTVLKTEGTV